MEVDRGISTGHGGRINTANTGRPEIQEETDEYRSPKRGSSLRSQRVQNYMYEMKSSRCGVRISAELCPTTAYFIRRRNTRP